MPDPNFDNSEYKDFRFLPNFSKIFNRKAFAKIRGFLRDHWKNKASRENDFNIFWFAGLSVLFMGAFGVGFSISKHQVIDGAFSAFLAIAATYYTFGLIQARRSLSHDRTDDAAEGEDVDLRSPGLE